jgi:hypothetical protein
MTPYEKEFIPDEIDEQLAQHSHISSDQPVTPSIRVIHSLQHIHANQAERESRSLEHVRQRLLQYSQGSIMQVQEKQSTSLYSDKRQSDRDRFGTRFRAIVAVLVVCNLIAGFAFVLASHNHGPTIKSSPTSKASPTSTPYSGLDLHVMPGSDSLPTGVGAGSISVLSANDIWLVARALQVVTSGPATSVYHWNGKQWTMTALASSSHVTGISKIVALSDNNVWGVGNISYSNTSFATLIEHWDGKQWSIVPSPQLAASEAILLDITAVSANNIWAVGYTGASSGSSIGISSQYKGLVEHWNGEQWSVVSGLPVIGSLNDVATDSEGGIWIFGEDVNKTPLIEYWDGKQWNASTIKDLATAGDLGSMAVISPTDIWITGLLFTSVNNNITTSLYIEHWDGRQWSKVPGPSTGVVATHESATTPAITALSANNVWIAGSYGEGGGPHAFVIHWDGTDWTTVPTGIPNHTCSAYSYMDEITSIPDSSQVWVTGNYSNSCQQSTNGIHMADMPIVETNWP